MTPRLPPLVLALLLLASGAPHALAEEGPGEPEPEGDGKDAAVAASQESSEEEEDEEESDETDEEWEDEDREVSVSSDEDGFDYESRRDSKLAKDEIRATFDGERSSFRFEYRAEGEADSEVHFRVDFVALVEHADADADGAYDVGEPVLQRAELASLSPSVATRDEGAVQVVDVVYALTGGGTLTLRFRVASEETPLGATTITPTMAKYDVILQAYPWSSPTTRVALETRTKTTLEADFDPDHEGEPGVEFARGAIGGFYRWVNTTLVDGRAEPVGATVLAQRTDGDADEYEHESVVLFSYAHGASITHDPSVGVERLKEAIGALVQAIKGDWRIFSVALLATAALVLATALPRLRRR